MDTALRKPVKGAGEPRQARPAAQIVVDIGNELSHISRSGEEREARCRDTPAAFLRWSMGTSGEMGKMIQTEFWGKKCAPLVVLATQCFWTIDALAAETARVVSLPRLHAGGLAGMAAVIAVAGLIAYLRRGR